MDFQTRTTRYADRYPENEKLLQWLRKEAPEPVLEPELPICDPHHHLWDHRGKGALPEEVAKKFQFGSEVYLLEDMLEDVYDGHNVVSTVYVEAFSFYWKEGPEEFRPIGEVEFCQGVAAQCDSGLYGPARVCAGIQGRVDLRHPNVEEVLKTMMQCRNFCGVRGSGPFDDDFKRGMRALEKHGLVLDVFFIDPVAELPQLQLLAMEFPGVAIVADHLGGIVGPVLGLAQEADWRAAISELASTCPNVLCKVGGVQMKNNGFRLHERETPIGSEELAELVLPWYGHAIDCFGTSRCMFESNFPPDKDSISYRVLWNTFKRIAAKRGMTAEEKSEIFHDTAVHVYSLKPISPAASRGGA
ncbi:unnamed protein product [Polarella glacialis]|uniref:Amidohydrolase-related domain-containing protein n=1 Tax=Polarella glacialis TaxID=89957 RepID=A0A813F9J9_POLGL|nr:unnamed protein product [Polarella glacialis]